MQPEDQSASEITRYDAMSVEAPRDVHTQLLLRQGAGSTLTPTLCSVRACKIITVFLHVCLLSHSNYGNMDPCVLHDIK